MSVRKNVTMKEELAKWIEENSDEVGISESAFIVMILTLYKKSGYRA